jgi:catechol 2,3-dioxygenase-like lactoylglutathione lyase family enzyme
MTNAVNHIAVSVTDIHRAMSWYRDVLGMTVLVKPIEVAYPPPNKQDGGNDDNRAGISERVKAVFGPAFSKLLISHLSSSNGVGIELFQFIEPKAERRIGDSNFEYWKTGFFHIAITDPKIEELAARIASNGGKKRTEVTELAPGSGKKICFCEDPDGNIIEIYSHSYEQFWANS